MEEKKAVRMSLELSPQLNAKLDELSEKLHASKADVLRKAIALIEVAVRAKEEGKKFGVAAPDQELSTEIVGL